MTAVKQDIKYLTSKIGNVDAATKAKAIEIIKAANAAGRKIRFVWGMGGPPEHSTGRALDLMTYSREDNEWVRNYIWANRARLKLQHVIANQTITSTKVEPGVRRKMADRGSVTENHFDHNHVLFLSSTYVAPSAAPAKTTSKPKPAPQPSGVAAPRFPLPAGWYFGPASGPRYSVSGYYSYRANLMMWQKQMKARGWNINTDGHYTEQTANVAEAFQKEKHLGVDRKIGAKTWAAAWNLRVT